MFNFYDYNLQEELKMSQFELAADASRFEGSYRLSIIYPLNEAIFFFF